MKPTGDLTKGDWQNIEKAIVRALTMSFIMTRGLIESTPGDVIDAINECFIDVKGNRSDETLITWGDARLGAINVLRKCLSMIEESL